MSLKLRHLLRFVRFAAATVLAIAVAIYLYGRPDPALADAEQYKVFSDYLEPGLTGESHDLGSRQGLIVVSQRTKFRGLVGTLPRALQILNLGSRWPPLNLLVANLRSEHLQRRFTIPAKYVLATESEIEVYWNGPGDAFLQKFPGSYGYITFTRVGFNRELTEALFYTEHICGLCGEGKYVYMRKVNGRWVLQAQAETWIS